MSGSKHPYRKVPLLVDDNGHTVWRTFEAKWLVGFGNPEGSAVLGVQAEDTGRWGPDCRCVLEGAQGKFAVYRRRASAAVGRLRVLDSVDAIKGEIPDDILEMIEVNLASANAMNIPKSRLNSDMRLDSARSRAMVRCIANRFGICA
jgi:hypothetical protein